MTALRMNLCREPATLDPRKGGDVISSHVQFLLFDGLTRLMPDGSYEPALAERYEVSDDGKRYTFYLREALWSDGTVVTAKDFEMSWKDILDPNFPALNAHLFYSIKNAEAAKRGSVPLTEVGVWCQDEKTLIVELEAPTPYFLDLTSFCVFYPVNHRIDREHPDWAFEAGESFVGCGPFLLKEWKHHDQIVLERNPTYWNQKRFKADRINFSMIDHESTALQMFENGALDLIGAPLSPLPVDALPTLNKSGKLRRQSIASTMLLSFNTETFPFNNEDLRKAFAYAVDRSELTRNITQMGEEVALDMVPTILKKGKSGAFFKDGDREAARAHLEKGLEALKIEKEVLNAVVLHYATSDVNHKVCQAIQQQWKEALGIDVKLQNGEHKVLMNLLSKRQFQLAQSNWTAQYADPMNILQRFKLKSNVKNHPGWENQKFISLLDRSDYEFGENRLKTLEEAERIFMDAMPATPIFHWNYAYMMQPGVSGIAHYPTGGVCFDSIVKEEIR